MQRPIPRIASLFTGLVTAVALVACASAPGASPTSRATAAPPATSATTPEASVPPQAATPGASTVEIFDRGYRPSTMDVAVGTMVTWANTGNEPHTVTFDDGTDSGSMNNGDTFDRTFDTAGSFAYHCAFHPEMLGTINVTP